MFHRRKFRLRLPSRTLLLGEHTLVMGVLNVTPDSFSDGGLFLDPEAAAARAIAMERAGADIIDIGGESTRPGSTGISMNEELRRVLPVLAALRGKLGIPISVDTSKSQVAEAAAAAGAEILNDVTALRHDPQIAEVAGRRKLPLILMHMRGEPATMQKKPFARDVLRDVIAGLRRAVAAARRAGLATSQLILDPGIGFGKSYAAKLRIALALARTSPPAFPHSRWHIAQKLHRRRAPRRPVARRKRKRPHLGHSSHGGSQHPARCAHRPRPRRGRNGPSSPRQRRNPVPAPALLARAAKMSAKLRAF